MLFLKKVGIICEYNPFHNGHKRQFDIIRSTLGDDTCIVCLMSGNYVQRGAPAIFDKMTRAKAAIQSGADIVLELPITAALSSAEGFASAGVRILSPICDYLCFGAETANVETLMQTANVLLSQEYTVFLKEALSTGISFPAARQKALNELGYNTDVLLHPNDILAVEYCKAILKQNSKMQPLPIFRQGDYHDTLANLENPSATSLRKLICDNEIWSHYTTDSASHIFKDAVPHITQAGQRAILSKLRTMDDDDFAKLPFGSEGLWRKLMHASREQNTLEEIITATKSKRYTRTRLERMIMCAFLGITEDMINKPAPYTRILAFNDIGRSILNSAKKACSIVNVGELQDDAYQLLENRSADLYGLFAVNGIGAPSFESKLRVFYKK